MFVVAVVEGKRKEWSGRGGDRNLARQRSVSEEAIFRSRADSQLEQLIHHLFWTHLGRNNILKHPFSSFRRPYVGVLNGEGVGERVPWLLPRSQELP